MKVDAGLFRLLGDEARLRLLRLLDRERLNVSELVSILGIAQSGVSRHLRLLREAGLVEEERSSGWAFYRTRAAAFSEGLLQDLRRGGEEDIGRLKEVLRLRTDRKPEGKMLIPGRSWAAWARALGTLLPRIRVADLGCGEGYLALEVATWASHVVAVDHSPDLLAAGRAMAAKRRLTNITWKKGDVSKAPLPDASVDLAILSQTLHCLADPAPAIAEAKRILSPGGRVLVIDLEAHEEAWVLKRLGHQRLGFRRSELQHLLAAAGFEKVHVREGDSRRGDPFVVLVADAAKPGGRR